MRTTTLFLSLTATFFTTALAQDDYASAPASNVTMTTILPPANCTSGCTTVVEPCTATETPAGTAGTGVMPPATGSATYHPPSGPSATKSGGEADAPPAYTGAAAAVQIGGFLMAVAGLHALPALV
jgi:hypothetical protein